MIMTSAGCPEEESVRLVTIHLPTRYYQQFDADFARDVPAEGYGGWQVAELELSLPHTAVVVMHAWDCGTRAEFPGWHHAVEYIPRADIICRTVLPPLLSAARAAGLRVYHVVAPAPRVYYEHLSGYQRAIQLAGVTQASEQIPTEPVLERLRQFRAEHVFPGIHNQEDVNRGFRRLGFAPNAEPQDHEGVAENGRQLYALCKADGINHLVYAGFAINWCLLMSPGGMVDMSRQGLLCSALRQAVTAVENRETARQELCKELALWRVSVAFGFVYDVDDFVRALSSGR
jgi:hypothetical protein